MHTVPGTNEFIRLIKGHDHPTKASRIKQPTKPVGNKQNHVQDEVEVCFFKMHF